MAKEKGISSTTITAFKGNNNLIKVFRGLYRAEDAWEDIHYEISRGNRHRVNLHDQERTLCDIHKIKEQMDIEIFSKAWKLYIQKKDKEIPRLVEYAGILDVEEPIRNYLEVLL